FRPELVLGETAQELVSDGIVKTITTNKGTYPTKTVIIAAGAGAFSPTKIGVEQEDHFHGKGLHYGVKSLQDFEGKNVAIVGGGDSAFDWCLAL
ncbi:NAD(P)-binding domain-containing protein, partial [Acinetobacter baumannii]